MHAVLAVALDGHAANEHDTPTVDELARDAFELGAERRQREVVTRDVEHVVTVRLGVHERGVELVEMRVGELEHVGVAELVAAPFARGLERGDVGSRSSGRSLVGADCGPRMRRPGQRTASSRRSRT